MLKDFLEKNHYVLRVIGILVISLVFIKLMIEKYELFRNAMAFVMKEIDLHGGIFEWIQWYWSHKSSWFGQLMLIVHGIFIAINIRMAFIDLICTLVSISIIILMGFGLMLSYGIWCLCHGFLGIIFAIFVISCIYFAIGIAILFILRPEF